MSTMSTHVLDARSGQPAGGVPVALEQRTADGWQLLGRALTDADGRTFLAADIALDAGVYRLTFDTGFYLGAAAFYPEVSVTVRVTGPGIHHHVPLLLSPFAYTTYRGS